VFLITEDTLNYRSPIAVQILIVTGHNQDVFRMALYRVVNYNLVKKEIIVLAIDPPGQGEYLQYFDPKINYSSVGYSGSACRKPMVINSIKTGMR